jgi:hypothetical protein
MVEPLNSFAIHAISHVSSTLREMLASSWAVVGASIGYGINGFWPYATSKKHQHAGLARDCAGLVCSEFEAVVVSAMALFARVLLIGRDVDLGCGVGYFAEAVDDVVASVE